LEVVGLGKLEYSSLKDDGSLILTNFNCSPSLHLLRETNLYKIIWSLEKIVTFQVDGYQINLKKDEVLFCTPLNIVRMDKDTRDLMAIVFNREFYCIRDHDHEVSCNGFLFFGSSHPPIIELSEREKENFKVLFRFFKEEFETKDQIQGEMLRNLLKRLLIKSSRLLKKGLPEAEIPNTQLDIIRKFNVLVEMHFREKHQVAEYANLLHKSPKTIANLFHKYSDKTPLTAINERVAMEAKRLLLYSEKTSEEIAYELGYSEPGHFSKFFKKNVGCSPIEFKKKKLVPS
jgi:AraC-like DNA-binding protein